MIIQWLGHSSFLIVTESGTRIVTDPYEPGGYEGAIRYGALKEPVDVVTISHEHPDHNYVQMVGGSPIVVRGAGEFVAEGVSFFGVPTMHDKTGGSERGKNTVFVIMADGMKLCHLGDLGHMLTHDQAAEIGSVDVLLAPVGGHFTIDADEAWQVADMLSARVVVPMHFKTEKIDFPIGSVDQFTDGKANIKHADSSKFEISKASLPVVREVVVLKHAL